MVSLEIKVITKTEKETVLNEKGLTTEEGHPWKTINVYSVLKRYSEREERLKFRRKKYPLVRGKMWMEFTR